MSTGRNLLGGVLILILSAKGGFGQTTLGLIPSANLTFSESAAFDLLQVELSQDSNLKLLERNLIESIFEEQSLQLAFGAGDGEKRRSLGNLVKAEILVLLEARETKTERFVRMVVFRTGDGIRLSDTTLIWDDKNPEPLVESLHSEIGAALEKHKLEEMFLVAISPIQSQNLLHTFDHLQETYASFIDGIIRTHPRILPLAIEEARNISEEIALSGGEGVERRSLPYFIQGSFRHEGKGEELRVNLSLELLLGGKTLVSKSEETLKPGDVPEFIEQSTLEMAQAISASGNIDFDPLRDAQALADRGESFRRMGEYEKSLAFYESALLTMPELKIYHRSAMMLCQDLVNEYLEGSLRTKDSVASGEIGLSYALRMLDHLEQYIRTLYPGNVVGVFSEVWNGVENPINRFLHSYAFADPPLEIQDLVNEYVRRRQEVFVTFVEEIHARGILIPSMTDEFFRDFSSLRGQVSPPDGNPGQVDYQVRLINVLSEIPGQLHRTLTLIRKVETKSKKSSEEEKFLAEIASASSESIRFAFELAEALEAPKDRPDLLSQLKDLKERLPKGTPNIPQEIDRKIANVQALSSAPTPANTPPTPTPIADEDRNERGMRLAKVFQFQKEKPEVIFKPLPAQAVIPYMDEFYFQQWLESLSQWMKMDNGLDLIAASRTLWTLDREGAMTPVFEITETESFRPFVQDAAYVWIPIVSTSPKVLAIERSSMKMTLFTSEDGLPPTNEKISLLSLSTGEVLVVGQFDRTWIGTLRITPPGDKDFKLVHEARKTRGSGEDIETAFSPGKIWRLESENRPGDQRVAIVRALQVSSGAGELRTEPKAMVVNLNSGEITLENVSPPKGVDGPKVPTMQDVYASEEYRRATKDPSKELEIRKKLFQEVEEFRVLREIDEQWFAFGIEAVWLMANGTDGNANRKLVGIVPSDDNPNHAMRRVFLSNRFGVLYQYKSQLYQVNFQLKDRQS